jgi:hypothetical protein
MKLRIQFMWHRQAIREVRTIGNKAEDPFNVLKVHVVDCTRLGREIQGASPSGGEDDGLVTFGRVLDRVPRLADPPGGSR